MQKKKIITISGGAGSGKSSTADLVAKILDYKRFSSGDFMRKIALDLGITLNELNVKAQTDDSIDKKIDDEVKKVGKMDKVVIDSRLAFHWIPESFKVYLELPPEAAKQRILKDLETNKLRQKSETSSSAEEVYSKITSRLDSERKRYKALYNIDHTDKKNFDLIIDTNENNLEKVAGVIVSQYKKWIGND